MNDARREALAVLAPCVLLAGQAGVGKTSLAVSFALDAALAGEAVTVIDLDIVNPYFRLSEARERLEAAGVRLIAPQFAEVGSNLDAPGLTAAVGPEIERFVADSQGRRLIIDLGGEADGARTLGRFAEPLLTSKVVGCYGVVNAFRPFSDRPEQVAGELLGIAAAARIALTGLINNAHLMAATDCEDLRRGRAFARAVADVLGLPLVMTTEPNPARDLESSGFEGFAEAGEGPAKAGELIYPIRLYPTRPWDGSL